MALVWTDIRDLPGGQFSALTQDVIERYLVYAGRWMDESFWGDDYDDGLMNLTAHLLAQDLRTSGGIVSVAEANGVSSFNTGPTTVVFKSSSSVSVWPGLFRGTIYGERYAYLLSLRRPTPFMVF